MAKRQKGRIKPGNRVEWNTSEGKTLGRVEKKLTSATPIKDHTVAASSNNPEYLSRATKAGKSRLTKVAH